MRSAERYIEQGTDKGLEEVSKIISYYNTFDADLRVNLAFNPATLTVKAGTKVTWTNNDSVLHTVTSDSGGVLGSTNIPPGQSFSFTFTAPGTVSYHCAVHPSMKGSVTVTN